MNFNDRHYHAKEYALHRDLLRIRNHDPVFRMLRQGYVDGAVLGPDAFVLRYFGEEDDSRLVLINLGVDLALTPLPEPLMAPPRNSRWTIMWSSEDLRYGGGGTPPLLTDDADWVAKGHSVLVLIPIHEEISE